MILDLIEEKLAKNDKKGYLESLSLVFDETKQIIKDMEKIIPNFNQNTNTNTNTKTNNHEDKNLGELINNNRSDLSIETNNNKNSNSTANNYLDSLFSSIRVKYAEIEFSNLQHLYNQYLSDFHKRIEELQIQQNLELNNDNKKSHKPERFESNILVQPNPSLENIEFTKFFISENQLAALRIQKLSSPQEM